MCRNSHFSITKIFNFSVDGLESAFLRNVGISSQVDTTLLPGRPTWRAKPTFWSMIFRSVLFFRFRLVLWPLHGECWGRAARFMSLL